MSFNVSGLASGLDTNALVDALMFSERAGLRRLEASAATQNDVVDAWTDIEGGLENLETAIDAIRTGGALDASLAESGDEAVLRVTAQGQASPGTYAFRVSTLAAAHQVTSAALASGTDLVGAGTAEVSAGFATIGGELNSHTLNEGTYTLTVVSVDTDADEATVVFDGIEQTVSTATGAFTVTADDGGTLTVYEEGLVTPGTGSDLITAGSASITVIETDADSTVNSVAASLNATGGPVRAQVIDTGDGTSSSFRLVLTSRETGLDHEADMDFSGLSLFSGGFTTLRDADDASITLGDGGLTITRSSNSIGDLFDGLSIDLVGTSPDTDVEVVVTADVDAQVAAVTEVVDKVTRVLNALNTYGRYDVDSSTGGPLVGSFAARSVSSELSQAMTTVNATSSFSLLSQIGVSIGNDGTYSVDETELRDALTANAADVEFLLLGDESVDDDGVLDAIDQAVAELLGDSGRIISARESAEENISGLEAAIDTQEARLVAVEDRYRRQFSALESLIGQLQSQSGFLAGLLGQAA